MVEKRTMAFMILAMLVWALVATGFTAYYYMEQTRYQNQLEDKQQLLNDLSEKYDGAANKRNLLLGEYGMLFGEYQWFQNEDYSSLLVRFQALLSHMQGNYTSTLYGFSELTANYNDLSKRVQALFEQGQITKEEFGSLLNDFYKLFSTLTVKEFDSLIGEIGRIEVNLCIDYGNGTIEWHNTSITSGTTLFDLTRKVAKAEYSYSASMGPGHIFITSINGYANGWWIWYFWSDSDKNWISGPVGCDAWVLNNNGIYKWACVPY